MADDKGADINMGNVEMLEMSPNHAVSAPHDIKAESGEELSERTTAKAWFSILVIS